MIIRYEHIRETVEKSELGRASAQHPRVGIVGRLSNHLVSLDLFQQDEEWRRSDLSEFAQ